LVHKVLKDYYYSRDFNVVFRKGMWW